MEWHRGFIDKFFERLVNNTIYLFIFFVNLKNSISGILLVVLLLGHGLVAIPKRLWREKNEKIILE